MVVNFHGASPSYQDVRAAATNVIIMTGCEPGAIRAMALEARAFGFVAKPFTPQVFLSLIHQALEAMLRPL